jgi:cytoskeleton protein RodZ
MNVGLQLRHVRKQQRLTLRDISNRTKVPMGALEAIERNDLARLPGGIFTRGFLRSYAAAVGLDPTDVVQEFLGQFDDEPAEGVAPPVRDVHQSQAGDAPARRIPLLAMLVIAIGGSLAVYAAYPGSTERDAHSSPVSLLPAAPVTISNQELVLPSTPSEVRPASARPVAPPTVLPTPKAIATTDGQVPSTSARPPTTDAPENGQSATPRAVGAEALNAGAIHEEGAAGTAAGPLDPGN